jgi:hypothetical protein
MHIYRYDFGSVSGPCSRTASRLGQPSSDPGFGFFFGWRLRKKPVCSSSSIGTVIMKKSILLASLLAAIALTACGKKEEMPVAPAAPAVEPAAAPAPAAAEPAAAPAAAEPAAASTDAAATPTTADAAATAVDAAADAAKMAADKAAEAAKGAVDAAKEAVKPAQ